MTRFLRNLALSTAVAATALAAVPAAQAQERVIDRRTSEMIGIGMFGIAAGAIVGSLLATSEPARPVHREPRPRPHQDRDFYPQPPAHPSYDAYYEQYEGPRHNRRQASYEAWSPEWYRWCENRYRSFNGRTGTFTTFSGQQRFCVVN